MATDTNHLQRELSEFISPLKELLGPNTIFDDKAVLEPHLQDERRLFSGRAGLLARPFNIDQVSRLLAYCSKHRIGVVPQGGNTGYCGGATPLSSGSILLKLDRINAVREINQANFSMTLEAGVSLASAQEAAKQADLLFPLSMGSQGSAQIGGVLSTNGGGINVLRYGMAKDLTLGLEYVLANGEIHSNAKGLRKDNTGIKVSDLLIGAEGTLGIITAATLKLFPYLQAKATALIAVESIGDAIQALSFIRRLCDDNVIAFELITQDSAILTRELLEMDTKILVTDRPMVLIEIASSDQRKANEQLQDSISAAIKKSFIKDGIFASTLNQQENLWRIRESIPEAERKFGGSLKHDISVSADLLETFLEQAKCEINAICNCRFSIFGHLGDGNIHFNVLAPKNEDPSRWKSHYKSLIENRIFDITSDFGGSFSAEHGIGILKKDALIQHKSKNELAMMQNIKQIMDPIGILNPGKIF